MASPAGEAARPAATPPAPAGTLRADFSVRFSYPVHFTRDLLAPENELLAATVSDGGPAPRRVLVAIDAGLLAAQPDLPARLRAHCRRHRRALRLVGEPIVLEGGEAAKAAAQVELVHDAIAARGICRHSYVLAIGGGAVLDAVGFAASTAHRGVRLIRVPTTVLAQNDSAIGVKTAINRGGAKNFVGTFAPPWAVLNDSSFLQTLPDRDWRAGTIEALKVGLLRDAGFVAWLESSAPALLRRDLPTMERLIHRCAQLHLDHIAGGDDPFESGSSRPLDFGHWAAHKLEQLSGYELRHGEAVAVGIALDATYSHLAGLLSEGDWLRVLAAIRALGLPVDAPGLGDAAALLEGLEEFRQHLGGRLTIMVLEGVGRGREVHRIDPELVVSAVARLREGSPPARA